ncbi:phospholipase D-like domain-containing protein [Candidatus Mycoplasma haematominutum]|uniref:phospholipase D-like domain-containing protein n=1 Tax=Candidatus Mycoplasma haematominutum TaxID=209446 RepID=UPI00031C1A18|nr:phospholipase D-like domain-containing protein [Candidatus Mycoplasma haematominutum]
MLSTAFVGNYLLTIYVVLRLYSNFKRSHALINFYCCAFLVLPFIFPILYFGIFMDKISNELQKKYREIVKKFKNYEDQIFHETFNSKKNEITLQSDDVSGVIQYNKNYLNRPLSINNSLKIIEKPKDHLNCIANLIKRAKKFIHIEYYIFSEGYVFNYLVKLLAKKIQEGVEVRIIIDGWGNFLKISSHMKTRLNTLGINYKIFNPLLTRKGELWWNFRNHNKIIIVDSEFAFFGSCNISDEYFNITDKFFPTVEMSMFLEGEIVSSFNLLFSFMWNMIRDRDKRTTDPLLHLGYYFPKETKKNGNLPIQLVHSSPLLEGQPIKSNLVQLIYSSKKIIRISTPYFYPPQDVLNALKTVSQSGVKVQIILPKEADLKDKVLRVHRKVLTNFLTENIEIYEFFGFNHEKLTIFDDDIVYFGTYNWDYRSFYLNFESALLIKSKQVGLKSIEIFLSRLEQSHRLDPSEFSYSNKIIPNIFIGISRWCRILS